MAIANSDGSIILSTKVDPSGINKGMSQMQGKATNLTKTFAKLGAAIASAFAIQKIVQFSKEAAELATQTEASVQRLVDIYGSASDSVGDFIDSNARALGMSKAAAASFSSVYGNLFSVWADQETNAELTNEYLRMTAVVASKTGRTVEDVQERVRSGLLGNTEAIEDLGIFVNVKTIEMTDAFQRMADGKSWEQLDAYTQQQIRSMAILEQATAKYGDEVADTSATIRNRYKAAYEDFQNTWGKFVNTILMPILEILTQVFDIATKGMNALLGNSGNILEDAEDQEESSDKTAENINNQTENQKELNKEMKKTLAGFDDIQILSDRTAENTSNIEQGLDSDLQGLGGSLGVGSGDSKKPDGSAYVEEINKTLAKIMEIISISMMALGLILLFTGNVGWGIGLIIAGAALYAVTEAALGKKLDIEKVKQTITDLLPIISKGFIAIGLILMVLGHIPLGIGFIIAGVALENIDEFVSNGPLDIEKVKKTITDLLPTISDGLIAIGLILIALGNIPLGIGFIVAGAKLEDVKEYITGEKTFDFEEISKTLLRIMGTVALSMVAVGLILLFFGNIKYGVGFIVKGAALLGVTGILSSTFEYDGVIQMITTIMGVAGGALLALGIILLWIGGVVGTPIAIGMIVAGGALIVSAVAAQAAFAPDDIAAWLSLIMGIAGGAMLALGIILCMVGSIPVGVGLIIAGVASLGFAVALNFDAVVEAIKGPLGVIMAIVGAAMLVIGIILVCTGVGMPLGIALIAAGAASLVTVTALNWDAIWNAITGAFNAVIDWIKNYGFLVLGILLCLTGGLPFGFALILKWAKDNAEEIPLANKILEFVESVWNSVKVFWNRYIAHVFTAKFWLDLAKNCGNGLIGGFEAAINGIIGMFETMINWIVNGLNKISFNIPEWLGGGSFGINIPNVSFGRVSIPRLAQGAVIPPNKEFLAVLGDQKHGTNIEAPLQTIVDAFNIALSQNGGYNGGNTEVILEIDGREFGRAVVEQGNRENRRIGTRLVIA